MKIANYIQLNLIYNFQRTESFSNRNWNCFYQKKKFIRKFQKNYPNLFMKGTRFSLKPSSQESKQVPKHMLKNTSYQKSEVITIPIEAYGIIDSKSIEEDQITEKSYMNEEETNEEEVCNEYQRPQINTEEMKQLLLLPRVELEKQYNILMQEREKLIITLADRIESEMVNVSNL